MESVEVAAPPNAIIGKLLVNETLGGANRTSFNATSMSAGAELGPLCSPAFSRVKQTALPPLQKSLQSGSSGFKIPMVELPKMTLTPPSLKTVSVNNWNQDKPVNHVAEAFGVTKRQETVSGQPAQLMVDVEAEKKYKGGIGSRGGGTSRKRPRSGQTGPMNELDFIDTFGSASVERIGPSLGRQCFIDEKVEKRSRKKTNIQGSKRWEKRNSQPTVAVTTEHPSVKGGVAGAILNPVAPCVLDIYGLKTRPVDLEQYMGDICLKDLLAGDFAIPQPKGTTTKPQSNEKRESFKSEISHCLQHLPEWSGMGGFVPISKTKNMGEKVYSSKSVPELTSKLKSRDETGVSEVYDSLEKAYGAKRFLAETSFNNKIVERAELMDLEATKSEVNPSNGFSVDTLPIQSFESFTKSLKLQPCESVEDLITHAAFELDGSLADSGSVPCLNHNTYIIPPFSFSLPPVATSKLDMGLERGLTNGKLIQRQWIQGSTVANELSKKNMKAQCQNLLVVPGSSVPKEIRHCSSTHRKLDLEGRSDRSVEELKSLRLSHSPAAFSSGGLLRSDVRLPSGGSFVTTPQSSIRDGHSNLENILDSRLQGSATAMDIKGKLLEMGLQSAHKSLQTQQEEYHELGSYNTECRDAQEADPHEGAVNCGFANNSAKQGFQCNLPSTKMKLCCNRCSSHIQSNLPGRPVSPRVITASGILYHIANCLQFSEVKTGEKKTRRRALQPYPGAPSQEASKHVKLGQSTAGSGAVYSNVKNEQKDSKGKRNETFIPISRYSSCERRKSLSQVSDAFPGTTKPLASTIQKRTGWISGNLQAMVDASGSQSKGRFSRSESGSQDQVTQIREIGKRPASYTTTVPPKVLNGGISRGNRNLSSGGHVSTLLNQRPMDNLKSFSAIESYKGGGLDQTGQSLRPNVGSAGNIIGTGPATQYSSPSGKPMKTSRQMLSEPSDSQQKTKQEVTRGRSRRP